MIFIVPVLRCRRSLHSMACVLVRLVVLQFVGMYALLEYTSTCSALGLPGE